MHTTETASSPSAYGLKTSRYSSHSLILRQFQGRGEAKVVLDVGGGEGYLSAALARTGCRVVCLAQPGSVRPALPKGIEVVEADLDFARPHLTGPFDHIVCGDVLEHLRDPLAVLGWLKGLLKPGGTLVTSLPNGTHLYVRLHVLFGSFPKHDRGLFDRTHLHFFSWGGWRAVLAKAGFEIVGVQGTAVPFTLLLTGPRASAVALTLEMISFALANAWRGLFAYQFVVTARSGGD